MEVTWSLSSSKEQTMTQLVPVGHDHAKAWNQLVPILPTVLAGGQLVPWRPGLFWQMDSSSLASRIVLAGGQLVPGAPGCANRCSARPWHPGLCWQTLSSSLASRTVLADRQLVPGPPDCACRGSARPFRPGLCWQNVSSSLASRVELTDGQLVLFVPDCAGRPSARPWRPKYTGRLLTYYANWLTFQFPIERHALFALESLTVYC